MGEVKLHIIRARFGHVVAHRQREPGLPALEIGDLLIRKCRVEEPLVVDLSEMKGAGLSVLPKGDSTHDVVLKINRRLAVFKPQFGMPELALGLP
jgi:hypothetical protein